MITKKTYQTPRNTVVQMQSVQPLLVDGSGSNNTENVTPGKVFGPNNAREEVQIVGSSGW